MKKLQEIKERFKYRRKAYKRLKNHYKKVNTRVEVWYTVHSVHCDYDDKTIFTTKSRRTLSNWIDANWYVGNPSFYTYINWKDAYGITRRRYWKYYSCRIDTL